MNIRKLITLFALMVTAGIASAGWNSNPSNEFDLAVASEKGRGYWDVHIGSSRCNFLKYAVSTQ